MKGKHYFDTKLFKLGQWVLLPADSMNWHGQETRDYFEDEFGFGKGILHIHDIENDLQHCYCPTWFSKKLRGYVFELKKNDYKGYEKKVKKFYTLRKEAKEEIPNIAASDYSKLLTDELVELYRKNRDWAHRITIYDQFGWLGEDIFDEAIDSILVEKYGLKKGSEEYNRLFFTLTKPEEISTTLEEKRDVLGEALKIVQDEKILAEAAAYLADTYGWMPVFTYGDPWKAAHYKSELKELLERNIEDLKQEHTKLVNYSEIRDKEIKKIVAEYDMSPKDLQIFIDFGLMLDVRNEAEYVVSFAGYYLLPIYKEISRRTALSIKQLRVLTEDEIVACIKKELNPYPLLNERRKWMAWGYDENMENIIFFSKEEADKLFEHVEKTAEGFSGPTEDTGICASPGTVTGTVKIVADPKENSKVNKGDILITAATTVDHLPAMKKAAAFVTESGGQTCHAAVVAREFGVPCIVSLKNAMSKFKDGDRVEVDAETGIVRKV